MGIKMVKRDEILSYLNELLHVSEFDDACVNGLQVEGKNELHKIIFGVSVSQRLFQQAVANKADMIFVHHGLFWKSNPSPFSLTGIFKERLALLLKNDINLVGYHLPLDAHAQYGNNAQLMKKLAIEKVEPIEVGFLGKVNPPVTREKFVQQVKSMVHSEAQIFPYGAEVVSKVLVISGGSSPSYHLAKEKGADTFIGGDIRENIVRELEETKINYINAGHYHTEKFGVQALCEVVAAQFDVQCIFIDISNPV
jgi:dinuclear metal center YbgI/SA1388 family protein